MSPTCTFILLEALDVDFGCWYHSIGRMYIPYHYILYPPLTKIEPFPGAFHVDELNTAVHRLAYYLNSSRISLE